MDSRVSNRRCCGTLGPAFRQAGFSLPELMIATGIVSILASQAIPSYMDYITRAKITEGLHMAMLYEPDVTEYFTTTGQMPSNSVMGTQGCQSAG